MKTWVDKIAPALIVTACVVVLTWTVNISSATQILIFVFIFHLFMRNLLLSMINTQNAQMARLLYGMSDGVTFTTYVSITLMVPEAVLLWSTTIILSAAIDYVVYLQNDGNRYGRRLENISKFTLINNYNDIVVRDIAHNIPVDHRYAMCCGLSIVTTVCSVYALHNPLPYSVPNRILPTSISTGLTLLITPVATLITCATIGYVRRKVLNIQQRTNTDV